MKPMATVQDLIEEAKLRTVYWVLCIFAVSYFLSRRFLNFNSIVCLCVCGLRELSIVSWGGDQESVKIVIWREALSI